MIYRTAVFSSLLSIVLVAARQYPACQKWCGKDWSDSSSSSQEKHHNHHNHEPRQQQQQSCGQCPTAAAQTTGADCMQFDPSMYATTLDEALYNFPNLVSNDKRTMFNKNTAGGVGAAQAPEVRVQAAVQTSHMPQQPPDVFGPQIMSAPPLVSSPMDATQEISASQDLDDDCSSVSCRSCKLHVINGFLDGPVDAVTNATLWATKQSLESTLNGITPSCPQSAEPHDPTNQRRGKRQNSILESVIGTTQTISCDYTRGNPVTTDTRFCGLCSLCWGWRQLPEDYFPTYLNEVLCSTDTTCLQGFGKCNAVTRSINVLRKKYNSSGGFKYEQTTIDTVTSCECQVEYGSTIFNLVYANDATN